MIHHLVLYKLKPELTGAQLEEMMMLTRIQLLKIPDALHVRCGRRLNPENEWPFFVAVEFASKERYAMFKEDPIYIKFLEEIVRRYTSEAQVLDYETEPKRKYS
jgi:hypothetical protein